jgi:crotonobetainyl-CoA:carnitine CoA-transferase CaiB-like acyl-CoA transferase
MALALEGLRVLDLSRSLPWALATMIMADNGADVIKVEPREGDTARRGEFAFIGCQPNKRAIAIDLKHPASHAIVEHLIASADRNPPQPAHRRCRAAGRRLGRRAPD